MIMLLESILTQTFRSFFFLIKTESVVGSCDCFNHFLVSPAFVLRMYCSSFADECTNWHLVHCGYLLTIPTLSPVRHVGDGPPGEAASEPPPAAGPNLLYSRHSGLD